MKGKLTSKILAIETATSRQSVAVLEGERVVGWFDQQAPGSHARSLVPTIDRLLRESGLLLRDLDGFAVSIGPGSFTGLRVGLATVLGFRLVTGRPIVTVPTLEALALNVRGGDRPVCPILKARTDLVYWALFSIHAEGQARRLIPEQVGPPSAIPAALPGPVTVLGEGWLAHRYAIRAATVGGRACFEEADAELMWPSAVSVGRAGQMRLACGEVAGATVTPLYVQRSDAELFREAEEASR